MVTGATGALGGSVVARFVAAGRPVLAVGRDREALVELAGSAPEGLVAVHAADLAEAGDVAALFDAAGSDGGTPAAVVHLAGGFRHGELADLSDDDWRFLQRANVDTTFRVLAEAARRFAAAGEGAFVAVSAPVASRGAPGVGAYAAAKAAVLRLVEAAAREWAGFGGRANAVLPGTMDTPANRAAMPDADRGGWVSTEAVAEVIHYLTTEAARGVNGAAVRVTGPAG